MLVLPKSISGHVMKLDRAMVAVQMATNAAQKTAGACRTARIAAVHQTLVSARVPQGGTAALPRETSASSTPYRKNPICVRVKHNEAVSTHSC
mmetsp:Transcript_132517/g.264470  ORF Transcript_132517/g.264470 Transcript_132517/m.264470 type:complete len:93 (-) Transcript_132517:266-544(-)